MSDRQAAGARRAYDYATRQRARITEEQIGGRQLSTAGS
jgi:hypothetical protein